MDQQATTWILVGAGAATKWLRGFPWFNDAATVAVAVAAAVAMTVVSGHAVDAGTFFTQFGGNIQTVLATLGAGHLLAKMSGGKILPQNNAFANQGGK
jgi:hypothetical protein